LEGRVVGTEVLTAGGRKLWALLGNIDTKKPEITMHLLTISIFSDGRWFTMARYHDVDRERRGPSALASFLGIPLEGVFPISYDIRDNCLGEATALLGTIEREPQRRLSKAEIIALAVE
jgi:hypothetical protein